MSEWNFHIAFVGRCSTVYSETGEKLGRDVITRVMSSRVKEASCSSDQAADHSSALGGGQQKCEREHEHEHEHGHGHEHEHGHGQEQSRIPILMSSPSHLRRTGSLKLRSEIRWTQRQGDAGASTPSQPLRRHRSLVSDELRVPIYEFNHCIRYETKSSFDDTLLRANL